MNKTVFVSLLVVAVACGATTTHAALVVIHGATDDTTIFQNPANNAAGGGNGLFAGANGGTSPRRALIKFDVAAALPANASVQSVVLTLTLAQVAGMATTGPNQTIELHRIKAMADWGEGTAQGTMIKTDSPAMQGSSAAAGVGDATWNARHYSSTTPTLWNTPGGDYAAAASATAIVGTMINTPYLWGSTASLVGEVQGWLANPSGNNGWLLKNADESTATNFRAFYSSDVATATFFPTLSITYSVPEVSALALCAVFTIGGIASRRWFSPR